MSTPMVQHQGPINSHPHLQPFQFHLPNRSMSNQHYQHQHQHQHQQTYPPPPPPSSFSHGAARPQYPSLPKQPSPPRPPHSRPSIQVSPAAGPPVADSPSSMYSTNTYGNMASPQQYYASNPYLPAAVPIQQRRTLSNATSTSSSSNQVRRSSSNRSNTPSSYVALLRKQKATVWCDRSQAEDPRILAAQRLAKERAEREVSAGPGSAARVTPPNSHAGSFTSGVARKIRHTAPKATPYAGGNLAGTSVPLRLSATEVDDEDEDEQDGWNHSQNAGGASGKDDDWGIDASFYGTRTELHQRSGSGRSSNGSRQNTMNSRYSAHELASQGEHTRTPSDGTLGRLDEKTPLASESQQGHDYFKETARKRDASSPEDEVEKERKEDELRRRGSVDDRAMTMGNVRLFVANPDLDD